MGYQVRKNADDSITMSHETQTFNEAKGHMDIDVHGEITMSAPEWAQAAEAILDIARGSGVAASSA
ncbi:hypothetical protein [Blastococcus xanthinilyticus]|uniref:Uncharacterized protein n=1 Tax=Blastococcus xanthinilyticus TaxID=1564164 RepID=A0A5S5CLM4_9ACTN|nr:hypothetical protein [Blastococcus xanthinilyticus]TYP82020.1 hypothetical protein BD833_1204 [Blastococcus xanthinilyticus]